MSYVVPDRDRWSLPQLLLARAEELGPAPFASFGLDERSLSYEQTAKEALAVAAGLSALGLRQGDPVLIMLRNRAEFVLGWFGAALAGMVQVPVNVDYRGAFLEHLVATARGTAMIVEEDFLEAIDASLERLPSLRTVVVVGEPRPLPGVQVISFDELAASGGAFEPARVRPFDHAAIHFTSGTSGRSKGALVPHANLHLLAERNRELVDVGRGDVYLTELPLFHINAQMTVYTALLAGASSRVERRFSASRWLDRVNGAGVTHTSLLGVMLAFILAQPEREDDASCPLRVVWTVPCPAGPAAELRRRFGLERVVTSYGSTELGMVARVMPGEERDDAAGKSEPDFYEIRIVDERDEDVPPGEPGELAVRPRIPWTTTLGYVGMAEATSTAFRNFWFHTGDLARIDEDGYLFFLDRFSDRIRRRGENIASLDVELVLEAHPQIAEAAVIGVPASEVGGEDELKAVVVAEVGQALDADAVWAWCDDRLPHFAVPRYVEIVAELPKTPTAKVQKNELRAAGVGPTTADRGGGPARRGNR